MTMDQDSPSLRERHISFGWWSLLFFLSLGITLEALHGFKVRWYVDVSNETRQLLFTLGHAHGTLLALIHLAFAATLETPPSRRAGTSSRCLKGASLLLPGGFLLGGLFVYDGDPGLGILVAPVGALLLFVAVLLRALDARKKRA